MKVKIRSQYVAPPGKVLLACDLSQAESWVVAHLANEQNMKYSLLNSDIHTDTGAFFFHKAEGCGSGHKWKKAGKESTCLACSLLVNEIERYIGKQNNHANSYGMGAEREAQVINKQSDKPPYVTVTIKQCKTYQTDWHMLYSGIKMWHVNSIQEQLHRDRTLVTPYGFKRKFYAQFGDPLYKEAYAFIPQSTVADHFVGTTQPDFERKGGLIEIDKEFCQRSPEEFVLINMSHDSFAMEVPEQLIDETAERCKALLTRPMIVNDEEFTIPVDCESGHSLGDLKAWHGLK